MAGKKMVEVADQELERVLHLMKGITTGNKSSTNRLSTCIDLLQKWVGHE